MAVGALDLGRAGAAPAAPAYFRVAHVVRLALVLLVVAQLGRIPVLSAGKKDAPILLNDFLVMAVLAAGAIGALRRRRLMVDRTALFALAFAGVGGLSALLAIPRFGLSGFQFLFSIAYLVRWLVYFAIYLVVVNLVRRSDAHTVWKSMETGMLVFAGFGVFQSIFLPGFAQMVYPESDALDWDPQGHRLVSTFLDPNFAGAFLVVGLLVLLARMAYGEAVAQWKLLLLFAALCMTVSRGAILAFLLGALLIAVVRGISKRVLRFGALLVVLVIPAIPTLVEFASGFNKFTVDKSALSRVISWTNALEVFADNPIIGVGFNTYGFVQLLYGFGKLQRSAFGLDGGLLFIAVMTGMVGVALYTGMLASVVARCRRVWRDASRTPADRGLCLGTAAATLAMVVHSVFLNTLLYPFLMEVLWVLWGLVFLVRRPEAEDAAPAAVSISRGARPAPGQRPEESLV